MKKIFIILAILLCADCFAFDYGFLLRNDSDLKTDAAKKMYIDQKDSVYLWLKTPLSKNSENYFVAEGMYQFEYKSNTKSVFNYLDIDLLKLFYKKDFDAFTFELDTGRFFTGDLSSIIYAQNADGIFARIKNQAIDASVYVAYTGLLNANLVKMINSSFYKGADSSKVYSLADRYINTIATVSLPNLFAGQTLEVQGMASFRIDQKKYDRYYATVCLYGMIYGNLLYNVITSVGFVNEEAKPLVVSPLVYGRLAYYFSNASIGLNCIFAGQKFTGFTNIAALNSFNEPTYSSILISGLSGTYKPIENLLIKAGADIAFDGNKNYELKGVQYELSCDWQIVSDVLLAVGWKQYFDINKTDVNYFDLSVRARVSF
ncbi:hypothetical protein [Treponema sp.]|uniref:hypothetical protein n=1 Tax=Treponema sp. TaxID=166 RepID=UPI00298DEA8E|nr:hypothetical protein [Treponema sp.]MCR5614482.1 hypothetical protein [Treponema sp.]